MTWRRRSAKAEAHRPEPGSIPGISTTSNIGTTPSFDSEPLPLGSTSPQPPMLMFADRILQTFGSHLTLGAHR
jgi:hypothetical protein